MPGSVITFRLGRPAGWVEAFTRPLVRWTTRARAALARVPAERWLGLLLVLLLVAFAVALLLEPSVGRGGR